MSVCLDPADSFFCFSEPDLEVLPSPLLVEEEEVIRSFFCCSDPDPNLEVLLSPLLVEEEEVKIHEGFKGYQ